MEFIVLFNFCFIISFLSLCTNNNGCIIIIYLYDTETTWTGTAEPKIFLSVRLCENKEPTRISLLFFGPLLYRYTYGIGTILNFYCRNPLAIPIHCVVFLHEIRNICYTDSSRAVILFIKKSVRYAKR